MKKYSFLVQSCVVTSIFVILLSNTYPKVCHEGKTIFSVNEPTWRSRRQYALKVIKSFIPVD